MKKISSKIYSKEDSILFLCCSSNKYYTYDLYPSLIFYFYIVFFLILPIFSYIIWHRKKKWEIIIIWHIIDKYLKMRRKRTLKSMVRTLKIYFFIHLFFYYLLHSCSSYFYFFAFFLISYIFSVCLLFLSLFFFIVLELRLCDNQSTIDGLSLDICKGKWYSRVMESFILYVHGTSYYFLYVALNLLY